MASVDFLGSAATGCVTGGPTVVGDVDGVVIAGAAIWRIVVSVVAVAAPARGAASLFARVMATTPVPPAASDSVTAAAAPRPTRWRETSRGTFGTVGICGREKVRRTLAGRVA